MSKKQIFDQLIMSDRWVKYFKNYAQGVTVVEQLIHWMSQVNNMVDNVNEWNIYLDEFVETFDEKLKPHVIEFLQEMLDNGELKIIIDEFINEKSNVLDEKSNVLDEKLEEFRVQLAQKTSEINTLRNTKVGDGVLAKMGDLSQSVKEAMTGGSVAVVGEGAVGEVNLANDLKTKLDTTYLNRNVSYMPSLTKPHSIIYNGNKRRYTIPSGCRITYGKTRYDVEETVTLIDDFPTTALLLIFNHVEKTFYLKAMTVGVSESEFVLATIRRITGNYISYVGNVIIEGDVIGNPFSGELLSHNLMYSLLDNGDISITNPEPLQVKIVITGNLFLYNLLEGNSNNRRIIFTSQESADLNYRDLPILETGERAEDGTVTFTLNSNELLTYSYDDNTIRVRQGYTERNRREVLLAYSVYGKVTGGVFMELNNHLRLNELKDKVDTIEDMGITNTIHSRNKDVEHAVYAGADYNRSTSYDHFLTFLIGTDFHNDHHRLANMVDYGNKSPVVDAMIDLGDIMGEHFNDNNGTAYSNTIQKSTKPYLMAIGNHDIGNTALMGQSTTPLGAYNKFIAPNENLMELDYTIDTGVTYYYKDFSEKKVRVIVLNPYDLPDENDGTNFTISRTVLCFSQTQIDWFINVLKETPNDCHVLIAGHDMIENRIIELDHVFTNPNRILTPKQVNHGTVISDIVNAWKNGLSISETYPFTNTTSEFSSISATADFTGSSGIFIGYITGDRHVDAVFHLENYPDQRGITFDTSNYHSIWQRYISDLPRSEGNKSEDILTTMSFDIDRRVVNLVRIGANVTRYMKDRTFSTFEY